MGSLFKSPKMPASSALAAAVPPPPPPPTPMPDPGDIVLKARKKRSATQRVAGSGRLSTILSGGDDFEALGG